jgi:hypothetical protein
MHVDSSEANEEEHGVCRHDYDVEWRKDGYQCLRIADPRANYEMKLIETISKIESCGKYALEKYTIAER